MKATRTTITLNQSEYFHFVIATSALGIFACLAALGISPIRFIGFNNFR